MVWFSFSSGSTCIWLLFINYFFFWASVFSSLWFSDWFYYRFWLVWFSFSSGSTCIWLLFINYFFWGSVFSSLWFSDWFYYRFWLVWFSFSSGSTCIWLLFINYFFWGSVFSSLWFSDWFYHRFRFSLSGGVLWCGCFFFYDYPIWLCPWISLKPLIIVRVGIPFTLHFTSRYIIYRLLGGKIGIALRQSYRGQSGAATLYGKTAIFFRARSRLTIFVVINCPASMKTIITVYSLALFRLVVSSGGLAGTEFC